jgi:hypothetical protein
MPTWKHELRWLTQPADWGLDGLDARWLVLGIGLILVFFGSRTYKLFLMSPGAVVGVLLAVEYSPVGDQMTKAGIAVAAGMAGAVLMIMVEKIALSAAGGALIGGLTLAIGPLFIKEVPWYAMTIGGLIGAMLFPTIYRRSLRIVTPVMGALAVGLALERPEDLWLLGGLSVVGIVLQHTLTGKAP